MRGKRVSVVMPVLAVYMLVGDFFGAGFAYIHYGDGKTQGFAA